MLHTNIQYGYAHMHAVAEQVTEVRGGGAEAVQNLWQQGVWGAVLL